MATTGLGQASSSYLSVLMMGFGNVECEETTEEANEGGVGVESCIRGAARDKLVLPSKGRRVHTDVLHEHLQTTTCDPSMDSATRTRLRCLASFARRLRLCDAADADSRQPNKRATWLEF